MNHQYERADKSLIPVMKTMEYKNRLNYQNINYEEMFEQLYCIKEIMIPNIKYNCDCISALKYNDQRIVKAKLLEDEKDIYKIAIYDPSIEGIAFFDVSKKYFIIDDMKFLNYKKKDKSHKHYKKQWVL